MEKTKTLIGIDPDLHKSGITVIEDGVIKECTTLPLWNMFNFLNCYYGDVGCLVVLEDSTLGKSANWHKGGKQTAANVGKNQAISIILREFCDAHKLTCQCVPPSGYSKLFDDETLFRQTTGWEKQTNKDARASCAIVWGR
jgi:hypothetical protein